MVDFDRQHIGPVAGKTLLHPQCHIGTDTLSWAKLGARVTGFDFSERALEVARRMASRLRLDAKFVNSELYAGPEVIEKEFDIVYTGVGALCWLPDIRRWAEVMATFTTPGGTFYIREGHPMPWTLDYDRQAMAHMEEVEGRYYLPEGQRALVPLMYTIIASRM